MQDYILQIICVHVHFLCLHSNTGGCSDKITNLTLISILELENVASMEKKRLCDIYISLSCGGACEIRP